MNREDVFRALKIEDSIGAVGIEWEASEASFSKVLPFLNPKYIEDVCAAYLDNGSIAINLVATAKRLVGNPAAIRLLWHQHCLVVRDYERSWRTCYKFPELGALGEDARPYYLLLGLSGIQFFGDVHAKLGVPPAALTGAISDFRRSIEGSREKTGNFGLAPHYSGWWQGFFSGRLYRLGRLTFLQETFSAPVRVFEHRKTKQICILAAAGLKLNPEGLVSFDGGGHWQSTIHASGDAITGNVVTPDGFVKRVPESLSLSEWQEIVRDQDPILGVHISAGGPMAIAECTESFVRAIEFHSKYFPGIGFRAFVCESWLMDPSLAKFAKPESNIVQFQKRYFLVPSVRDLEFVSVRSIFGPGALQVGWENVPHTTSMQKGAAEFKRAGGTLRNGIGVIPWGKWGVPTH